MHTAVQQLCASCGNPALPDGKFCLFCGDLLSQPPHDKEAKAEAKLAFSDASTPESSSSPEAPVEYAGFWRRTWAGTIDVFLEAFVALIITVIFGFVTRQVGGHYGLSPITERYVTGIAFIFVLTMGAWLYCASSESSHWRATIGKRIMGLQVVTSSGGQLSFGTASVRHFMKFLSLFTASVGFMMVGWTKRHQALHDMPSDTLVIRVAEPSLTIFSKRR